MPKRKIILFTVLNWGLGHATRSIPIIYQYLNQGYQVVIASDGESLLFLKNEFYNLTFEELPSYRIRYSKSSFFFLPTLFFQLPHFIITYFKEKNIIAQLAKKYQPHLIISDNRFGSSLKGIKSIYITHQLRVFSGFFTFITTFFHRLIYKKYDEIWVPDYEQEPSLSGKLGHFNAHKKIKYIGPLTRLKKYHLKKKYDVLVILSGPEPQRSILKNKLLKQLSVLPIQVALVAGKVELNQELKQYKNIHIYNFLKTQALNDLINASEIIISRSGYTSVMDLILLQKKVIWIPTPGQKEQEYLAIHLNNVYGYPFLPQDDLHFINHLIQRYLDTH